MRVDSFPQILGVWNCSVATVVLPLRAPSSPWQHWSTSANHRANAAGRRTVSIAASSRDVRVPAEVNIAARSSTAQLPEEIQAGNTNGQVVGSEQRPMGEHRGGRQR